MCHRQPSEGNINRIGQEICLIVWAESIEQKPTPSALPTLTAGLNILMIKNGCKTDDTYTRFMRSGLRLGQSADVVKVNLKFEIKPTQECIIRDETLLSKAQCQTEHEIPLCCTTCQKG